MNENLDNLSFDQLVPTNSNFLKKEDVTEDGVILTIKGFRHDVVKDENGQNEQKVVMDFMEHGYKPMVLNSTNSQLLKNATGCTVAGQAKGRKVVVYNDPNVSFGAKVTGGLRIKRIPGAPSQPRQPTQVDRAPEPPPITEIPGGYEDDDVIF
jgi:hypothetical protein